MSSSLSSCDTTRFVSNLSTIEQRYPIGQSAIDLKQNKWGRFGVTIASNSFFFSFSLSLHFPYTSLQGLYSPQCLTNTIPRYVSAQLTPSTLSEMTPRANLHFSSSPLVSSFTEHDLPTLRRLWASCISAFIWRLVDFVRVFWYFL